MLCKVEENLKQSEAPAWQNPTMMYQEQRHHLPIQHPNIPQEIIIPRKRLEHQKNKQDPVLNLPEQNSAMMKPLDPLSTIKVFPLVDIWRNIYFTWLDRFMIKFPRRDCYKTASSIIDIVNGKVSFYLSIFNDHALSNFKNLFCFHYDIILISHLKVSLSAVKGILNLSCIGITQKVFSVRFI